MEIRSPAHGPQSRDLLGIGPVEIGRVDFSRRAVFAESPPTNPLAIRGEKRTTVVSKDICDLANIRPIGIHHVQIQSHRRVVFEEGFFPIAQGLGIRRSVRGESDQLAVRAIRSLCVIAHRLSEFLVATVLAVPFDQFELRVVVPSVAALLARGAKVQFGLLFVFYFWVELGRGK